MSRGPICDDFEYPTPQRETMWTLPDKRKAQMARQTQPRDPNDASDIHGATHGTTAVYVKMQQFTHKPDLFNTNTVDGAAPRRLVPIDAPKNNPLIDKSLMTKDLPAASPNAQQFKTGRCTDPLQPQYPIGQKVVGPTTDPSNLSNILTHTMTLQQQQAGFGTTGVYGKASNNASLNATLNGNGSRSGTNAALGHYGSTFNPNFATGHYKGTVRDGLKIDDITGTKAADNRSNTVIRTHSPPRDPINYNDVPMSTAGSSNHHKRAPCDSMSLVTSDICKRDRNVPMQSSRNTDPLQPIYNVTGAKGTTTTIGEVKGSKPKAPAPLRNDRPLFSLRSDDIDGAQPIKRYK